MCLQRRRRYTNKREGARNCFINRIVNSDDLRQSRRYPCAANEIVFNVFEHKLQSSRRVRFQSNMLIFIVFIESVKL